MKTTARLTFILLSTLPLIGCGDSSFGDSNPFEFMSELVPRKPSDVAKDLFNPYDADQCRKAINLFASSPFGGAEAYMRAYRLMITPGSAHPDPTVQAAALRALGTHGSPEDVRLIVPWLNPSHPKHVRVEAATALQRIHNEEAAAPLVISLRDDEAPEVRTIAAGALAQYPSDKVFQALVGALHDADFTVVSQSVESLELMTGQAFGEESATWLEWAEGNRSGFAATGPYFYPYFVEPPSWLDKMQFWREEPQQQPRRPAGTAPSNDGEPEA